MLQPVPQKLKTVFPTRTGGVRDVDLDQGNQRVLVPATSDTTRAPIKRVVQIKSSAIGTGHSLDRVLCDPVNESLRSTSSECSHFELMQEYQAERLKHA
jgi:hypothetical protein